MTVPAAEAMIDDSVAAVEEGRSFGTAAEAETFLGGLTYAGDDAADETTPADDERGSATTDDVNEPATTDAGATTAVAVDVDEAGREDALAAFDDDGTGRDLESPSRDHLGDLVPHDEHVTRGQVGSDSVKDAHVAKQDGGIPGGAR